MWTHTFADTHIHSVDTWGSQRGGYDVTSITIITRHKSCGVTPCHRLNGCPMCQPGMAALYCRVPQWHRTTDSLRLKCVFWRFFFSRHSLLNDTKWSFMVPYYRLVTVTVGLTTPCRLGIFSWWIFPSLWIVHHGRNVVCLLHGSQQILNLITSERYLRWPWRLNALQLEENTCAFIHKQEIASSIWQHVRWKFTHQKSFQW